MSDDETTSRNETTQAEIDDLWQAYLAPAATPAPSPAPAAIDDSATPEWLRPVVARPAPSDPPPARPQAQGDLLFLPGGSLPHWAQPISTAGIDLVSTGNGHRLEPQSGRVWHAAVHDDRHVIAVLDVEASAIVTQPRGRDAHTPLLLGPGLWQVRQQTEVDATALGFRRVAD